MNIRSYSSAMGMESSQAEEGKKWQTHASRHYRPNNRT
jgi:hypothetical protein